MGMAVRHPMRQELHGSGGVEGRVWSSGAPGPHNGAVKPAAKRPTATATDRRTGQDRRRREEPAPRGWERRRGVEPRRPEVQELDITPSQWDALHSDAFPPAATAPADKA